MRLLNMPKKTMAEKNVKILGIVISAFLIICSLGFVGNIIYEINPIKNKTLEIPSEIISVVNNKSDIADIANTEKFQA